MSQAPRSLGIDVAKAKFDVALLCEQKLTQRTFSMDPEGFAALGCWIRQHGVEQVHACLEATGEYGAALALALFEAGHLVSIVNPARIAAYAKSRLARTKTDKADAALIAHFCAQQPLPTGPRRLLRSRSCRRWCDGWRCCRRWHSKRRTVPEWDELDCGAGLD